MTRLIIPHATREHVWLVVLLALLIACVGLENPVWGKTEANSIRVATFNASLYRDHAGQLLQDLGDGDAQAAVIAAIIQQTRPDIVLINEFDYDSAGAAARLFQEAYLSEGQHGADPIEYPYIFSAPSNTGVDSGHDLDNNGRRGEANDAFGHGQFEGQYGMVLYSQYPIHFDSIRTFRTSLWSDMPDALLPVRPGTQEGWYSDVELSILPLSSKSHWDVPILIGESTLHVLASHPTPPVFDGPEDANGRRNHDEIRFWADYVVPEASDYIIDDAGQAGGLSEGAHFVILGDLNADPNDGDSTGNPIRVLLDCPAINGAITPGSDGAEEQARAQGRANATHTGNPQHDTADFSDRTTGNLRADYVLPSVTLKVVNAGVFWPLASDPLFSLVGIYPFPGSDHRLVWMDLTLPANSGAD